MAYQQHGTQKEEHDLIFKCVCARTHTYTHTPKKQANSLAKHIRLFTIWILPTQLYLVILNHSSSHSFYTNYINSFTFYIPFYSYLHHLAFSVSLTYNLLPPCPSSEFQFTLWHLMFNFYLFSKKYIDLPQIMVYSFIVFP